MTSGKLVWWYFSSAGIFRPLIANSGARRNTGVDVGYGLVVVFFAWSGGNAWEGCMRGFVLGPNLLAFGWRLFCW